MDNGPEFIASALEVWAHDHNVELLLVRPGKLIENAFIESLNSRVRDERMMSNRFRTIFEARLAAEDWRNEYNTKHLHSSLVAMTPEEFLVVEKLLTRHRNHYMMGAIPKATLLSST